MKSKTLNTIIILIIIVLYSQTLLVKGEIIASGEYFIKIITEKDDNTTVRVTLQDGEYYDDISIKSNTEIYGTLNPKFYGSIIIRGNNVYISNISINIVPPGTSLAIVIIDSSNITLDSISVKGGAIAIYNSDEIKMRNLNISKLRAPGIIINNSNSIKINDVKFNTSYDYHVSVCNSKNILVDDNIEVRLCETQDPGEIRLVERADIMEPVAMDETGEEYGTQTPPGTGDDSNNTMSGEGRDKLVLLGAPLILILVLLGALVYTRKVRVK